MNRVRMWRVLVCVALLLCATSAMAAEKPYKTTITVPDAVTVNGTTLSPGDYQVTWLGNAGQVELTILKGKKVVTTVQAKVEARKTSPDETILVTSKKEGALRIAEIRPEGMKQALLLDAPTQ